MYAIGGAIAQIVVAEPAIEGKSDRALSAGSNRSRLYLYFFPRITKGVLKTILSFEAASRQNEGLPLRYRQHQVVFFPDNAFYGRSWNDRVGHARPHANGFVA